MSRTEDWRADDSHSFLRSTRPPHKGLSASTISNWLKHTVHAAGIEEDFTSHSTRAASASKANLKGLSIKEILTKANWTNASTFYRHYNKFVFDPKQKDGFSETVFDTAS